MHLLYNKEEKESQEIFKKIFYIIKNYWENIELNNPNSIFFKNKITEKEFKRLCPKSRGTTLKILRSIKLSLLKKGKCYYSQRDFAKKFKVNQSTIKQSIKLIEKTLQTKFIPIPKEVFDNGNLSKYILYRQILIPPSLFSKIRNLSVERGNLSVDTMEPECRLLKFLNKLNNLQSIPIYLYNNLYFIYIQETFPYLNTSYLNKEKSFLYSHFPKTENDCMADASFLNKGLIMKYKLKKKLIKYSLITKPSIIVSYDTYGLHPRQFMNHVESHSILLKWFDILVENNIPPEIENTKKFIGIWNESKNTKFKKYRNNQNTFTFKNICIALTYRMWSENITIHEIEKAINNFEILCENPGRLFFSKKKYDCLTKFFWNSTIYSQKDYFKLCLSDKNQLLNNYYNYNTEFKTAFERVRKIFGFIFYKDLPEEGKKAFYSNYKKFVDFTNEMVYNHRTKIMLSFFKPEEEETIEGFTRYIKTYFEYIYQRIKKSNNTYLLSPSFILQKHPEFVLWLKTQEGWEDFFKDKKSIKKS